MLTEKWLGEIATIDENDQLSLHPDRLVRHLLLFDQVIISSGRLREFEPLIGTFGFDGVMALLRSGALQVHLNGLTVGQTGQLSALDKRAQKGLLPLLSYAFDAVSAGPNRREYVAECLQNVRVIDGLSLKQEKAIVREIASRLVDPVDEVQKAMIDQLRADLRANASHVCEALRLELRRLYGNAIDVNSIRIAIHSIDAEDFKVETNLASAIGLSDFESHRIVERALLAIGGLNQRLAEMQHYSALVNLWYRDLPVLGQKLSHLQNTVAPECLDKRIADVIALPTLPDLAESLERGQFDMDRFLELRSSDDGQAFRAWLCTAQSTDIVELRERAESLRAKLGTMFQSVGGRNLRLVVTTGLGLLPGSAVASAVVTGLDAFLLDRIFGRVPVPLSFLLRKYSSIFRRYER